MQKSTSKQILYNEELIYTSREIKYNILNIYNLFDLKNNELLKYIPKNSCLIIIDKNINIIPIKSYFLSNNITPIFYEFECNEKNKSFDEVYKIINKCIEYKLERREPIIAIGGGVLLDIVGFVASIYRRGVPYIKISTTLLAMVDVSVGIKTGINFGDLKNRIGSFYPPLICFNDALFLQDLPHKQIINGLGEIMKIALVKSAYLFDLLMKYHDEIINQKFQTKIGQQIMQLSIKLMAEELEPNLYEKNLERIVDYGHIFSKLFELKYDLLHGEAVNIDGFFCVVLSYIKSYISFDTLLHIYKTMKLLQLPTYINLNMKLLKDALNDRMEHTNGSLNLPLITKIGSCIIEKSADEIELEKAYEIFEIINNNSSYNIDIYLTPNIVKNIFNLL